jgi:hypothetical protein
MLYEGVSIDVFFGPCRPTFGDLVLLTGESHPSFPSQPTLDFGSLADLQFEQVDDYFGVRSLADDGDDVVVWLYPLVRNTVVHHHPGPFDALRLDFSVLRNPERFATHFLRCVSEISARGSDCVYRSRALKLGVPPDVSKLREDIGAIIRYWADQNVVVGSVEALEIDY